LLGLLFMMWGMSYMTNKQKHKAFWKAVDKVLYPIVLMIFIIIFVFLCVLATAAGLYYFSDSTIPMHFCFALATLIDVLFLLIFKYIDWVSSYD
jgi:hypothetical protein